MSWWQVPPEEFGGSVGQAVGRAVAGLVADGLTNPQIGARLYISGADRADPPGPHLFAKLDIASRA
jgi:hypothetical protein